MTNLIKKVQNLDSENSRYKLVGKWTVTESNHEPVYYSTRTTNDKVYAESKCPDRALCALVARFVPFVRIIDLQRNRYPFESFKIYEKKENGEWLKDRPVLYYSRYRASLREDYVSDRPTIVKFLSDLEKVSIRTDLNTLLPDRYRPEGQDLDSALMKRKFASIAELNNYCQVLSNKFKEKMEYEQIRDFWSMRSEDFGGNAAIQHIHNSMRHNQNK